MFTTVDHSKAVGEAKEARAVSIASYHEQKLASLVDSIPDDYTKHAVLREKSNGHWLSVYPSNTHGTQLSQTEFRDALLIRYT